MNVSRDARLAALRRQAELHPTDAQACRDLSEELELAGEIAQAAAARRLAIARRPDRPTDYLHLARLLLVSGGEPEDGIRLPAVEEATVALMTAIELDPDFGAAHRELARLDLARARQTDDAKAMRACTGRALRRCRKALELDPADAESYRVLGDLHFHLGRDFAKARDCYARAVEIDPANLDARVMLAAAHLRQEDRDAAQRELAAVLSVDPQHPLANEVLKEMG
jgi:tetratricopeptide (TPR) repeat protein